MERQEHGVARHVRLAHEPVHDAAGAHERRTQLEHKPDAGETDRHPRSIEDQRESERRSEPGGRDGGGAPLSGHRHTRLSPRRRDQHHLRRRRRDEHEPQQRAHVRFPLMPLASYRYATRRFTSSRLTSCCFALARAITTLAMPSLKYNSSGTMVSPLRLVPPMSFRISCAWSNSLRERAGGGLL